MAYPQVSFKHTVVPATSLVGRRRQAVAKSTLQYQLEVLKRTGRYDAFKLQWHPVYDEEPEVWPVPNHLFWDSDVAKWIEGACYVLQQQQDLPEIDAAVQDLVKMIRSAQQPDGYLNIHYTVVEKGKRFTNLRDMHEMYNLGHLIEAALAYRNLYGNDLLLEPIVKYVNLLCDTFGAGSSQTPGYPGHPEIELALLRLYEHTRDARHLKLARFFLTERGNSKGCDGRHYYDVEAEKRGDDPARRPAYYPEPRCMWYHQAHLPISEQQTVEGHSVRAMYLLTAVADLMRLEAQQDAPLREALYRLWDNMVAKKMYATGGIGAIKQWEGFGRDYFLPQGTDDGGCYSETCAAIGVMMLANRLLQIDLDARFGDILELCLYNSVLTSMSHDGQRFTYVNQLASSNTDASKREEWFTVACCPPNVLRLLGQIGGYIWDLQPAVGERPAEVIVNLYVSASATFSSGAKDIKITQQSDWPWHGDVQFQVEAEVDTLVRLRIPQWAKQHKLNPACETAMLEKGYLTLPAKWIRQHPQFTLSIPLIPRWIAPSPYSGDIITLARGPVIYCVEDIDNAWVEDHFNSTLVDPTASIVEREITDTNSGDSFIALDLKAGTYVSPSTSSPTMPFVDTTDVDALARQAKTYPELRFIPYYFRANRGGKGQMRVGLRPWRYTAH